MSETVASAQVADRVPRETFEKLREYVCLLKEGASSQNLVAASTLDYLWERHILDSMQLATLAPAEGLWVDVGSGGGLPGMVIACMRPAAMVLVEPRRMRAEFLATTAAALRLSHVEVVQSSVERYRGADVAVISARAVASLDVLFGAAAHLASDATCWLLPKGRRVHEEVELARRTWDAKLRLVPSITDPEAAIVVATEVHRRKPEA